MGRWQQGVSRPRRTHIDGNGNGGVNVDGNRGRDLDVDVDRRAERGGDCNGDQRCRQHGDRYRGSLRPDALRAAGLSRSLACLLLLAVVCALRAGPAQAGCLTLINGPVVVDVNGCKLIDPDQIFDLHKEKYAWIAGLDAAGRKKFLDTYRGLYIKVKVAKSKAVAQGFANEQGALGGETTYMFIPPSATRCEQIQGKRLAGTLREVCCEGGGDAPCLLETSYLLQSPQNLGAAASASGDATRQKARHSKEWQAGEAAIQAHKWKDAIAHFERARQAGELDVTGYYHMASALRELDECPKALPLLKHVADQHAQKDIWADEEADARRAIFLLARCYARLNDPQGAIFILHSYLLEPAKYYNELNESLHHKDFGWIHTSREYRDYEKEARKKLGGVKPPPQ